MRTRTRKPAHPGGILFRMHMEPLGITITELAQRLGISRKALSAIVNGRASITPDIALRLSRALGTTPELWLGMQQAYTLWETANTRMEWRDVQPLNVEDIRKLRPLTDGARSRGFSDAQLTANAESDPDNPLLNEAFWEHARRASPACKTPR